MSDPKTKDVNWDEFDDLDSDDDNNSSSSSSSDSGDEGKEEEKHHHHHHHGHSANKKYSENRYENNRGPKKNFQGNPNSNYSLYYRNDPDFFVKVIKKEDPPHELCVKIRKKDINFPDKSKKDISDLLAEFGCPDAKIMFFDDGFKIDIIVDDSDE